MRKVKLSKYVLLPHLLGILILSSIFVFFSQFFALLQGNYQGLTLNGKFGGRVIREIIIITIYFLFFKEIIFVLRKIIPILFIFVIILFLSIIYTLFKYQNIILIIVGIRFLEYIPLIGIVYYAFKKKGINYINYFFKVINAYILIFVFFEFFISIFELIFSPPVLGKTIFGSRIFGTFPSSNLFGFNMAVLTYYFYFVKNVKIMFITFLLSILSGSRLASITSTLVILYFLLSSKKLKQIKILFFISLPLFCLVFFKIYSLPAFSGRNITHISRLKVWEEILKTHVKNCWDISIGWGVGLGANTLTTVFGPARFKGQFISDSTYIYILSAFGLIGLYFYIAILIFLIKIRSEFFILWILILLCSIPVIWFENFPSNVIISLLWGCGLYFKKYSQKFIQK